MALDIVGPEAERLLSWNSLLAALKTGHQKQKAEIKDSFLYRGEDTLLSRAAWIDGLGIAVKTATIFPGNTKAGLPAVNGAVNLYADATGQLEALVDFHLVTKWKTAGDSLLAASLLARPDSRNITLLGVGNVARSMIEAYRSIFPDATFTVWNRTYASACAMADTQANTTATKDLESAVHNADIICTATMSKTPLVLGAWLQPGQHLDLIGAFRPDMREADDDCLMRGTLFVDSRDTTLDHIGELKIPLSKGIIDRGDIIADYYDIAKGLFKRSNNHEITIAKNGGGAHLDLMVARHILDTWRNAQYAP